MIPSLLIDLLGDTEIISMNAAAAGAVVADVTQDSSRVTPGSLFCCRRGTQTDGHRYAPAAVRGGASALLVERPLRLPVAQVVVADMAKAIPRVAAAAWRHPARHLRLVGVTGTNGKTTTTYLLQAIFEAHGWPAEVIGTLSGPLTTPEPIELQRTLAGMVAAGIEAVAMEVSSHGLVQGRVDATDFAVAVFTNLDRDHLDYHGDMESYFEAKATLFAPDRTAVGVINADDPWGRRLFETSRVPVVSYGADDAHPIIDSVGSTLRWRDQDIRIRLPGRFNTYNALAAATAAEALGVPAAEIAEALATAEAPPGRMEIIDAGQPFRVIVDCAHTPSALQQVLDTASESTTGRLVVVFGCGGDRDRTKRPQMGALVARNADVGILTSDNPRTESAAVIFADVLAGAAGSSLIVESDRRRAIALAVAIAAPGDTVLIAGKGDQTIQQVGPISFPFDDRVVAREEIAAILEAGGATGCPATVLRPRPPLRLRA